jgi:hypothetical protein
MTHRRRPKLSSATKRAIELRRDAYQSYGPSYFGLMGQSDVMAEIELVESYPSRLRLLTDVANLRHESAAEWFWTRWTRKIKPESTEDLIEIRNQLRSIWLEPLRYESDNVLDEWLSWFPSGAQLKAIERAGFLYGRIRENPRRTMPQDHHSFRCSIQASKLVPDFYGLRPMLIQGVFEHWRLFKFCANPSCAAPYFVARRRDQTICDAGECKAERKREHALKWWNENRAKGRKTPFVKTTKKGSGKNVTRKAR